MSPPAPAVQCPSREEPENLLAGKVHSQWVWRRDDQAHGGHEHVDASRTRHVPLAAFIVVLQDALVTFVHDFLSGKEAGGEDEDV